MIDKSSNLPILWESLLQAIYRKAVFYKVPLFSSIIVGFLAYTFAITNKYMSHDEVYCLFSKGGSAASGRWMLNLLDSVFPTLSMPWIYGVITILLISLSVCLIVSIFRIQSKLLQGLLAGCIIAFPSLISVMAYMFTTSNYSFAFFMSVLAVWLIAQRNKWFFLPGCACMVLSLATYQGFIALSAALLVILLIQKLMQRETLSSVIRQGFVSLFFLILSLGVYYLSTQVVNRYLGITFNGYTNDRVQFNLLDLPSKVILAYQNFMDILLFHRHGLVSSSFLRFLHIVNLVCCLILFALWFLTQKKQEWLRNLLLVIMLLLVPLAINCMYLFTTEDSIHTLVLYSFVAVYVLGVVLIDMQSEENLSRIKAAVTSLCIHAIPLCMALGITANVYIANAAFLNLHLRYEHAYSFYTSLIADIKLMPEFDDEMKLAVVGLYEEPEFYAQHFAPLDEIMGVRGFRPTSYSKDRFLLYYLDFDIPMATDDEIAQIQQTQEFQQMPCYPYYGSMQMFGHTLVVKVSN